VSSISELDVEEQRALSKASGAVGAFIVPTNFYDQIIRSLRFMGSIGNLATNLTTSSGETIQVPANTVHGVATWVAEEGAYGLSDETFAQVNLSAFKAGTSIKVSEELLTDSQFPLDSFLATEFGERIGVLEETGYVNGTGTGQPQGITDASAAVTVVTAASGNSLTFDYPSIISVIYAVPAQYRNGASFVIADGAAKNLRLLRTTDGYPIWSVNVAEGDPDTFAGYPVYTHPDMAAPAASAKSVLFGNIKRGYIVRRVDGFSLQRQNELYSATGQIGFRGFERVDGRVVLANAMRILQHSAT
jgi:HK97 family phage major capsid protein